MQDLKIVLVQANQIWENKKMNLENYTLLLKDVLKADVIVLPEMFHTGFSMNVTEFAETMDDSIGLNWLKVTALEKNAAMYTSLIILEDGKYYNRGVFVEPNGKISTYDKRKSFGLAGEDKFFTAGETKTIVEFRNWKIQLQICYDLRFPEIARNSLNENGSPIYDVLMYVANWPEKRSVHWKSLLVARAIENQAYVIGLNRVGEDDKGLIYSGDSLLAEPLGEVDYLLANLEEVKCFTISKFQLDKIRLELPFLKD